MGVTPLAVLLLAMTGAGETLESLRVTDVDTLGRCFGIEPYLVTRKGADTDTAQWVDPATIVRRCIESAVSLVQSPSSDQALSVLVAEEVRKNSTPEQSLKVFRAAVAKPKALALCNEMPLFRALKAALNHPADYPSTQESFVKLAHSVLDLCMVDKQFAQDFAEEAEAKEPYLAKNVCAYLKSRKIPSRCRQD